MLVKWSEAVSLLESFRGEIGATTPNWSNGSLVISELGSLPDSEFKPYGPGETLKPVDIRVMSLHDEIYALKKAVEVKNVEEAKQRIEKALDLVRAIEHVAV